MQETASAHTHKWPQTWSSGPVYVRNTRKSKVHRLQDEPFRIKTLPLTLRQNSKTVHTLSKMPNGMILNQVQVLSFPNVCFYSIINHILQATCKCFCSWTVSFSSSCKDGYVCSWLAPIILLQNTPPVDQPHKYVFIQLPITHNKLPVNVLQLQSFLFKFL